MQRWQCPIHNGTLKLKFELDIIVYICENWLFSLVVSLQKWRAFLQQENLQKLPELNQEQQFPHYWSNISRVLLWIGNCHFFLRRVTWNYSHNPFQDCARARDSRNPFIIKISIFKLFAPDNSEILRHGWNPIICWDKMGLKGQYHETDHPTLNQGF